MEVGLENEARRTGRDVPAAFITGLALAGVALGSLALGKWAFALAAGAIVLWAQGELYLALQRHHLQPATALGLASGGLVLGAAYFRGEAAMLSIFVMSVFATFLWYMAAPSSHRRGAATNIGVTILGVAYIPLMAGFALAMLDFTDGRAVVLSVIGLTFVYDTAAFIIGSWWGNRPLAPTISPKKSLEGAFGATLVVIAVSVGAVAPYVTALNTVPRSVALAVVVAVLAPLGDLAESLIKRDLGVKDMGSVLPGHGGVLDRIDSVLFVAPAAFLFLRLILS
jgi:phosphatidate cytidylyltransferase